MYNSRRIMIPDDMLGSHIRDIGPLRKTLASGMVAEWLFNGNGDDTSGYQNNLTLVDAPTYQTAGMGYFAQEGSFNGSSDYCTIANNSTIQFSNEFSYSLIWKGSDNDAMVFAKRSVGSDIDYCCYFGGTSDFLILQWGASPYGLAIGTSGDYNTLQDGNYHTLSFSHRYGATESSAYLDGKPISISWTNQTQAAQVNTTTLYVGKNGPGANSFPTGVVGLRMWNRVLSPKEHRDIHLYNLRLGH